MSFTQQELFPLTFDDFKKKKLLDLLIGIRNYRRVNWEKVPSMERYYHCAKQCFIKKYCKCGGNSIDANKFIERIENLPRGKLIENHFSKEELLKLRNECIN